jgi:hypothetical protein
MEELKEISKKNKRFCLKTAYAIGYAVFKYTKPPSLPVRILSFLFKKEFQDEGIKQGCGMPKPS